jgi:hypothetical protein
MHKTLLEADIDQFLFEDRDKVQAIVRKFPQIRGKTEEGILEEQRTSLTQD